MLRYLSLDYSHCQFVGFLHKLFSIECFPILNEFCFCDYSTTAKALNRTHQGLAWPEVKKRTFRWCTVQTTKWKCLLGLGNVIAV